MMAKKETKAERAVPIDPFEDMDEAEFLETNELETSATTSESIGKPENDSDEEVNNSSSLLDAIERARDHSMVQHPVVNQVEVGSNVDNNFDRGGTEDFPLNADENEITGENESIYKAETRQKTGDIVDDPPADALLKHLVESYETDSASDVELDEEDSQMLDELIAIIDGEIETAYGPGTMADLTSLKTDEMVREEQFVIFTLADTEYAVSIDGVIEVGRPVLVTPVPNVPDWLLGVSNLRGEIISIVDLRTFLGMGQNGIGQTARMMVAKSGKDDFSSGLIVDRVSGIRYLDVEQIEAPKAPIDDQVTPYLQGVYEYDERLLVVLDVEKLLLSSDIRQF